MPAFNQQSDRLKKVNAGLTNQLAELERLNSKMKISKRRSSFER